MDDDVDQRPIGPGHWHESLHTAYVLEQTWARFVLESRAVASSSAVSEVVGRAHEAMCDAYQAIGQALAEAEGEPFGRAVGAELIGPLPEPRD